MNLDYQINLVIIVRDKKRKIVCWTNCIQSDKGQLDHYGLVIFFQPSQAQTVTMGIIHGEFFLQRSDGYAMPKQKKIVFSVKHFNNPSMVDCYSCITDGYGAREKNCLIKSHQ